MNQLEEIQQTLLQIYTKNIQYFEKNNTELFNKIKYFESLNIENFAIDFIDNKFELFDKDGNKTYNCDPFYDASYRVDNLNDENTFSLIERTITNKHNVYYKDSINANLQVKEYINLINNKDTILNEEIKKMVFIGTLLGVHINDIDKAKNYDTYLIVEPNIEVFRLSLFLTDYTTICKKSKVFFCIDTTTDEFNSKIQQFIKYNYQYNTKIQFELASRRELDLVESISTQIAQNNQMTYPYSEYIVSMKRGYEYFLKDKNGILNINKLTNLLDKPVLYLGAGPSLASNLEWIYLNQDRFIIVVASAVLKRLELLAIIPDIIVVVDGQGEIVTKQFAVNSKMYKNSICIASIKIDNAVHNLFNENNNLFLIQDSFELFEGFGILTGITVGDIGISLLIKLGVNQLYLLGFDASVNHITGKTHDSLHCGSKKVDLDTKSNEYTKKLVYVKGNFQKEVPTFVFYTAMIANISAILEQSNINVYNLSDGAYFNTSIPLKIDNIKENSLKKFDKQSLKNKTIVTLKENCKINLTIEDIKYIKQEKKILQKLKNINQDKFDKAFITLQSNHKNSSILQLIEKYMLLMSPYAFYTNEQKLKAKQLQDIYIIFDNIFISLNKSL